MSATQKRTFQRFIMTKLKNEISVKNITLEYKPYHRSNDNISPNSSESYYIDSPAPPLMSIASSVRFP